MKRLCLALVVLAIFAAPALADVTVTMSVSMNAGPIATTGQAASLLKGTRFRSDAKIMGQDVSILIDPATKEQWLLNHVTKQVTPFDAQQAMVGLPLAFGAAVTSVKPLGQTKEILGRVCQGFTVEIAMPLTVGGETLTMKLAGPVWLAKGGPGVAEYEAAQKALGDAGMSMSPFGQGPQAKGMAEVTKALGAAGMVMEQEMHMTLTGAGQMAQMMGQMGDMTMKMTVTAISTEPIADEKFKIPDGYTKK